MAATVEVTKAGFAKAAQTGIVLQVNSNPVINPTLEVGQVSEQVEVQANASLVETRTLSVGQLPVPDFDAVEPWPVVLVAVVKVDGFFHAA